MQVVTTEDILINGYVSPPRRLKIDSILEVHDGVGKENGVPGWIWVRLPDERIGDTIKRGNYMQLSPFEYRKLELMREAA